MFLKFLKMTVVVTGIVLGVTGCSSQMTARPDLKSNSAPNGQVSPSKVSISHNAMMSAGALAFGRETILFVGDSTAGKIHAFDVADLLESQSGYQLGDIRRIMCGVGRGTSST